MRRFRSAAIAGGCLILSMAGFACGSDRAERVVGPPPQAAKTNIVGNDSIRATRAGSPERAIMTWAQAVQFGDGAAVRSAYSAKVRRAVTGARIAAAVEQVGALLGQPEIVNTLRRGKRAFVRVALISYDGAGRRTQQPVTLDLRKDGARWLLDDAELLLETAAALQRSRG